MKKLAIYISQIGFLLFTLFSSITHAAYEQRIYYAGMSCSAVQKDSVVKPANEIFIHTHVRQLNDGKARAQTHPLSGYYKNVTKGFGTPARTLIWQGRQQPVELRVTMWEYDDGGTSVHWFSNVLTVAIARKAGKQTPSGKTFYGKKHTSGGKASNDKKRNSVEFRSVGTQAKPDGPSTDPVTSLFKSVGDNVFGTANDLVGYQRVYLGKGNWAGEPLKKRGKISYHFVTHHRKGGANCKTYFYFERGAKYSEPVPTPKKPRTQTHTASKSNHYQNHSPQQHPQQAYNQSTGPDPQQCRQEYEACHHQAVQCQSKFDRQYKSCITGLNNKYEDCQEWHRKKHGRYELGTKSPLNNSYSATPKHSKLKHYPQCSRYKNKREYCGSSKSQCPNSPTTCLNSYHRCDSNAKLQQPGGVFGQPQPSPYNQPQPPQPNRPLTKEERGYLVWIKNSCKVDVSVAYRFKSFVENAWVTGGWVNLKPGEKVLPEIYTENSLAYFHSTRGHVKGWEKFAAAEYKVVNGSFKHVQGTKLSGKGLRTMPFRAFDWRPSQIKNTVHIIDCDTHIDKRAVHERGNDAMGRELFNLVQHAYRINSIQKLVKKGAPVNYRNAKGETPLFKAIRVSSFAMGALLSSGADINARDNDGNTPLHAAVEAARGRVGHEAIQRLVELGANVHAKNKAGQRALDLALAKGDFWAAGPLMRGGAEFTGNINKQDKKGNTLLHVAASNNDKPLATMLIEKGADINAKNKKGVTPLYKIFLSDQKRYPLIKLLLENGSDPNDFGEGTPLLHQAVLLKEKKSKKGSPKLATKAQFIDLLFSHGADINNKDYRGTALNVLVHSRAPDTNKLIKMLLNRGIDVNAQGKRKNTSLHHLAGEFNLQPDRIKLLLDHGADPNIKNKKGANALHRALVSIANRCSGKHDRGCKTDKEQGVSLKTVELLLANGADKKAANAEGKTPLKLAKKIKKRKLRNKIKKLLKK